MATILFHHNDIAAICRIALRAAGIDLDLEASSMDHHIYWFAETWVGHRSWQDLEDRIVPWVRDIVMCHHATASK